MCVTVTEADQMVAAARAAGPTLAVYNNRRHDSTVRLIRQLVASGAVGDVFRIEVCAMGYSTGGYRGPGDPWRADKTVSGGGLYDWGADAVDWVLAMVDSPMVDVTGFLHRFANGCIAEIGHSRAAWIGKPYLWYVLGTPGGIMDIGAGAITRYCQQIEAPQAADCCSAHPTVSARWPTCRRTEVHTTRSWRSTCSRARRSPCQPKRAVA